ncbi:hypothetical protein C7974DRAFT_25158 [Boeremia exigua]|uniref:uncharacterized protein n=1 Tax=Boeremia exigua TaxID=749465 RepID=UPI001E8DB319|nr:uncharacterized protein C7974DRAFT_25158 [Boeremia exigua]KAH6644641.1 hypothetical protein C7974DRAFT_25158 [Boeremia exigua]
MAAVGVWSLQAVAISLVFGRHPRLLPRSIGRAKPRTFIYLLARACTDMSVVPAANFCNSALTEHLLLDRTPRRLCEVVFQAVLFVADELQPRRHKLSLPRVYIRVCSWAERGTSPISYCKVHCRCLAQCRSNARSVRCTKLSIVFALSPEVQYLGRAGSRSGSGPAGSDRLQRLIHSLTG